MNPLMRSAELLGQLVTAMSSYARLRTALRDDSVIFQAPSGTFEIDFRTLRLDGCTMKMSDERFQAVEKAWEALVDAVDEALRDTVRDAAQHLEGQARTIRTDVAADFQPNIDGFEPF